MQSAYSPVSPVRVLSQSRVGPIDVSLVFAVGFRDEPPHLAGITHLVEHLIVRATGSDPVFRNATTTASTVTFWARGAGTEPFDYLERLARSIVDFADLTEEDVALERQVIEAEDPLRYHSHVLSPAAVRYGRLGFGAMGAGNPTVHAITMEEVVEWVRRWFTSDNAVMTVLGDEPAIAVILPESTTRPPRTASVSVIAAPVLVPVEPGGVILSLEVPAAVGDMLGHALAWEVHQRLRLERGLCYAVEGSVEPVDDGRALLDLVMDPVPANTGAVVAAVVELVREIPRRGFSADSMKRLRLAAMEVRDDPEALSTLRLEREVERVLLGFESSDADRELQRAAEVDGGRLAHILEDAAESMLVLYDEAGAAPEPNAVRGIRIDEQFPQHELSRDDFSEAVRRQRTWSSALRFALGSARAAVLGGELYLLFPDGAYRISLIDLAVLGVVGAERLILLSVDGRWVTLSSADWRRSASLFAAIVAAVPTERVRQFAAG